MSTLNIFFHWPVAGRWLCRCVLPCLLALPAQAQVLTNFSQVRALSAAVAETNPSVHVLATVLGVDPAVSANFFLHDGTAGCYVKLLPTTNAPKISPGTRVRLDGVAINLGYYPSVGRGRVKVVDKKELPPPVRLTADQIFLPEFDSAWVEAPALLTGYESKDFRLTLDLEICGLPFKAELPLGGGAEERAAALMQRPVKLHAVLGTLFNKQRQMTDRLFFVPSFDFIEPILPPEDFGKATLISVDQILTGGYGPQTPVLVRGLVTQEAAGGFFLRDATGNSFVRDSRAKLLPPGTEVEVLGFGDVAPFRPILRATSVNVLGQTNPPAPVVFNFANADLAAMHEELVTLQAWFLGYKEGRTENILQCRMAGQIFEALLPKEKSLPVNLIIGDQLALTGICELTTTHPSSRVGLVDGFRLHLSGAESVRVISPAPWWTPQRLMIALTVVSLLALSGLLGTWLLRRQVNKQMAVISESLQAEAVGRERDRMARDLHDTLEQQLSGVALQLDGLDDAMKANPAAASKVLALARRMLRYTRLEARRSVWDLRSETLEKEGLVAALAEMAGSTVSTGAKVVAKIIGEKRALPAVMEFHLFRIAQEALANAMKHAQAKNVFIELEYAPDKIRLAVRDDGCGFDPGHAEKNGGPHFGLLGMRERTAKIQAELTIASEPGCGCVVTVVASGLPKETSS